MKKNTRHLFLLLAFCCFVLPFSARATHVMGPDITWKCLGNDSFEIIVHAYRDCNGIPLSGTDLGYESTSGSCVTTRTSINASVCCATDITPVCSKSCDRCTDISCAFQFGIQQYTITGIVLLPVSCCSYIISWQECCRSGAINTGASGNNFYNEAYLNRCVASCDNSPYFTNPPVTVFCLDQCIVYNPGATDGDRDSKGRGDSLVYHFGYPLSDHGSPISYISPYSNTAPLIYTGTDPNATFGYPSCNGFHLDSLNGDIKFRATKADITVFAEIVDEYRRDSSGKEVLIGEIKSDIMISIINCPTNHPPIILGINGDTASSANSIKICADKQTCFTIKAFDLDSKDTDKISWNNPPSMNGATFTSDGKPWPTATFCWKPTDKNVRSYPYTFVATAIDKACPVPGRQSRAFSVYVFSAPPLATYSATISNCGDVSFQAKISSSSPSLIDSFIWTGDGATKQKPLYINGKSGVYHYGRQGVFHYALTVKGSSGCSTVYNDSVTLSKQPVIKLSNDTTVCAGITLTATATPSAYTAPITIWWDSLKNITGQSLTRVIHKDTVFVAHIIDATGCVNSQSMHVTANPVPLAKTASNKTLCFGDTISLGATAVGGNTYLWKSNPLGFTAIISNPKIAVKFTETFSLTETNPKGCSKTDSVTISVTPLPAANTGKSRTICKGASTTIGATPVKGNSYAWKSNPTGFSSIIADPVVSPSKTTTYFLTETTPGLCTASDSVTITVSNHPLPDAHWTMKYSGNEAYLHAVDSSLASTSYDWQFGDGDSSTGFSVKHLYPNNKSYTASLKVTNTFGCFASFDSTISVTKSDISASIGDNFALEVYPNPFRSSTVVQYGLTKNTIVTIALFDVTGREIRITENQYQAPGQYVIEINAEKLHLYPGIYLLKFMSKDGYVSRQIVKF